jgi:hypothetical protein
MKVEVTCHSTGFETSVHIYQIIFLILVPFEAHDN